MNFIHRHSPQQFLSVSHIPTVFMQNQSFRFKYIEVSIVAALEDDSNITAAFYLFESPLNVGISYCSHLHMGWGNARSTST